MQTAINTGKLVRFDDVRGYGFVAPDTGGEDLFLHVNDLQFDKRLLQIGKRVQFVTEEGERGLKASRVRILDDGPASPDSELTVAELVTEFTELLVSRVPSITGEQVMGARACLTEIARERQWAVD